MGEAMNDPEVIYDPIHCETRIGDRFKISDQMLTEMGLTVEDLLERVDFTKRSKALRTDLKIPEQ
jgi:hypothetical protein